VEEEIRRRKDELHEQLRLGEQRLRELDEERAELQRTLLRIAGAAQVLEELLAPGDRNGSVAATEAVAGG
jgi:hypothetical protein